MNTKNKKKKEKKGKRNKQLTITIGAYLLSLHTYARTTLCLGMPMFYINTKFKQDLSVGKKAQKYGAHSG